MYLGIDLGTSNSAIAGNADGVLRLFKTVDGRDVLPSVIYADRRGARFVGTRAYERAQSAPADVAQGFKRLMGTDSQLTLGAAGVTLTPEEASAEVLKTLVAQARAAAGDFEILGAVVTIPAAFNQMQSEATIKAARMAGLDRVGLIQEPVAAAMSALEGATRRDGRFLVYDLGGGTFDVALIDSRGGLVTVMAHEGVNMLGGRDFDRVILDSIVRPWLAANFSLPTNPQSDPAYKRLFDIARARAELAKIELSTRSEATVFVSDDEARVEDLDGNPIYIDAPVTRAAFDALIAERIDETIVLCRKLLTDNGLTHEDIDRLVFIGGPSNIPYVRERVPMQLGVPADLNADPMTAVARGAAIFAESRDWSDQTSRRKAQRAEASATGEVDVRFEFTARVADEVGRIRVRVGPSAITSGVRFRLTGPEGQDTGEILLKGDHDETVRLPIMGENRFIAHLTLADGSIAAPEVQLYVTRVHASASAATAAATVSVKVVAGTAVSPYNSLEPLVMKGTALPASGVSYFKTTRELVGGTPSHFDVEFFNHAEGVDDPLLNLFIGHIRVAAEVDLEEGQRLPARSDVVVYWRMDDNGLINCDIEVPDAGLRFDSRNFYVPGAGHKSFDGDDGQSLAGSSLDAADAALHSAGAALGPSAAPAIAALKRRVDRHRELLQNSADAEARRSVTEESRIILQELARLRGAPEHRRVALLAEIADVEEDFADIAENASSATVERMNTLLRAAKDEVARGNWDRARQLVEEMRSLLNRTWSEDPLYWLAFLVRFSDERYAALDKALHDKLVAEGHAAAEAEDHSSVRRIVIEMANNRMPSTSNDRDVAMLAGLSVG